MVAAPASLAAATDAAPLLDRSKNRFEKSTPRVARPIGGMITSFTSEFTTVVNAAPMMMPTAMSSTLPRAMNFLNSFSIGGLRGEGREKYAAPPRYGGGARYEQIRK